MSYVIQDTIWPVPDIPDGVKDAITMFYELADSKHADAGSRIAGEVFTPDASLITPNRTFKGATQISSSRDQAWAGITSREHRVSQVFSTSANGLDLMVSGTMKMVKDNGEESVTTYACHFKADQAPGNDGRARLTYAHVYVGPLQQ